MEEDYKLNKKQLLVMMNNKLYTQQEPINLPIESEVNHKTKKTIT